MKIGFLTSVSIVCSLASSILLGCGVGTTVTAVESGSTPATLVINGTVHAGQQPLQDAQISLYAAGASGNGSAATNLLAPTLSTDSNGHFTVSGVYACIHPSDQMYMLATGGNPGFATGSNNSALALMTALGNCGELVGSGTPQTFSINELTTVAAVWALSPFMASPTHIGASSTNTSGIANAFLDAELLVNSATGALAVSTKGISMESGKILALADAIASCSTSDGGASCTPLFNAATTISGSSPTETISAALNIVRNPANNVGLVFQLVTAASPYTGALAVPPHDWTMSITVPLASPPLQTASPTAIDIDASNNVWVAGSSGILNEVSPQGVLLSPSGFGVGSLNESYGLTIDTAGDVWVSNEESSPHTFGSLSKFQGSNTSAPGAMVSDGSAPNFYDDTIRFPLGLAADTNGNILIADYAGSSATEYSSSGSLIAGNLGSVSSVFPVAVTPDLQHGLWLASSTSGTVTHVSASGVATNISCCDGPNALATDAQGNLWVANYSGSSISELSPSGATLISQQTSGGIETPSGVVVDAGGTVWFTNYYGQTLSAFSSGSVSGKQSAGTAISPSSGLGLDANLSLPYAAIPDRSGNLWVSNFGNGNLVVFLGLATPTATPRLPLPTPP